MRKYFYILLVFLGIILIFVQPVRAHLTGSFQDFLIGLNDKKSTDELNETIKNTKEQHTVISKKTEERKEEFEKEQKKMLDKMVFYDTVAFDTYASFILDNEEIVDAMANQKIMQQQVEKDLSSLESLYHQYQSLQQALDSVEGYEDLLGEIKKNDEKKQLLAYIFPNLEKTNKEQFAALLQVIWEEEMKNIDEYLVKDSEKLSNNLNKWSKDGVSNGIKMVDGKTINQHMTMRYLIQKDHVYITYEHGDGHVILVTELIKHPKSKNAYYLEVEAGFLNGYALSGSVIQGLNKKFIIRYQGLVSEDASKWIIQQGSNSFILQPSKTVME